MTDCLEEWRQVPDFPEYLVSSTGLVISRPRIVVDRIGRPRTVRCRVLAQRTDPDGYQLVNLYRDGQQQTSKVHALVAEAFLGPRPAGMQVRHLNGDPADNRPANIAYGTCSDNTRDSLRHGTHTMASRTHCPQGHAYDQANTRTDKRGYRSCCTCDRARRRRQRAAQRPEAAA